MVAGVNELRQKVKRIGGQTIVLLRQIIFFPFFEIKRNLKSKASAVLKAQKSYAAQTARFCGRIDVL